MTSKLRVEMVAAAGDVGPIKTLLSSATIPVTGAAVEASQPAPVTPQELASFAYPAIGRLSCVAGAVCVTWDGSMPSEANGLRLVAGEPAIRVIVPPGQAVQCVELVDQPA